MFALTPGELAMVLFLFVLVWGAVLVPKLGEHIAVRWLRHMRSSRQSQQGRSPGDGG
jgi:hypothetical protein